MPHEAISNYDLLAANPRIPQPSTFRLPYPCSLFIQHGIRFITLGRLVGEVDSVHFRHRLVSSHGLHLRHTSSDRELALDPPPFQKVWATEGNSGARCVPPYFTLVGHRCQNGQNGTSMTGIPLPKWIMEYPLTFAGVQNGSAAPTHAKHAP